MDKPRLKTRCPAPGDTIEYNDSITPSYCNGNCFPDLWWESPDFDFWNDSISPCDTVPIDNYTSEEGNGYYWYDSGGGSGNVNPPTNTGVESGSTPIKPIDCSKFFGDSTYYLQRYQDYVKRYGINSSIYYISYGLKYCAKFMKLRDSDKLTDKGKQWVDKTLLLLQQALENIVQSNPSIESDDIQLKKAAFETHPTAYVQGGLLELGMEDKIKILLTVEYGDLIDHYGREQVMKVSSAQISYYLSHPSDALSDAMYLKNNWQEIFTLIVNHISSPDTRGSVASEQSQELIDLLLGEQINYFYDTFDGFELIGYER